jgi:propanediol dehydratase large subunit
MASKFKELMQDYGKIKQFPMDGPLMPLTEEQAASTQDNSSTKSQQVYYEANRPTTEAEEEAAGIRTGSLRRLKMRRMSEAAVARSAKVQGSTKK